MSGRRGRRPPARKGPCRSPYGPDRSFVENEWRMVGTGALLPHVNAGEGFFALSRGANHGGEGPSPSSRWRCPFPSFVGFVLPPSIAICSASNVIAAIIGSEGWARSDFERYKTWTN
uniref:Uncharacterized protein n=1 Tax=Plectus sambesii TaxID=2011161 RepID=A0A914X9N8_9BILA